MSRALIVGLAASAALLSPVAAWAAPAKARPAAARSAAPAKPATPQIGFTVVSEGKGASPGPDDVVLVAYIGKLADGTIFDQDGQAPLPVGGVVPGFSQALRRMKKGGNYHVVIPPSLAYGAEAKGEIPANSTLTFDILVFDFKSMAEIQAMKKQADAEAAAEAAVPAAPVKPTP